METGKDKLTVEKIKAKAVSGVVTFTLRTLFIQIFTFAATFTLTILLDPSVFGVFYLVSAVINFFVYFSDVGLAAALIQKKNDLKQEDLKTTFTIQQTIVISLVVAGLIASSKIANFYGLNAEGLFLLRVLLASLVLSSLKTIPSILLERNLNFTRLVIPQVVENVLFYSTALILALLDFGLASFSWAVIVRGISGLIIIYLLSPWMPKVGINRQSARKLVSFGIPFQLNSILALAKDDFLTIVLAKLLPLTQIGFVGWAQRYSALPLRFFMDSINKVTFPAYSRLQEHRDELGKVIDKSLFFVTYLVYPSVLGMMAIAPYIVNYVPNYQKWQPALPLLYMFGISTLFSAVSTTFTNTLFAIGKPKIVLSFMVFWTTLTWLLTIPLVLKLGYLGVGISSMLVATTSVATAYFVKKTVTIKITRSVLGPLVFSALVFVVVRSVLTVLPENIASVIVAVILGAIIYFMVSFSVMKKRLVEDAKTIIISLLNK